MGGFFLSNCESDRGFVINAFKEKQMNKYIEIKLGEYFLYYYSKINVNTLRDHVYEENGSVLVAIGTFFYNGYRGQPALIELLKAMKKLGPIVFNDVIGHYNFIYYNSTDLYLITDKTGTFHSYVCNDQDVFRYSSSILPLLCFSDELQLNKQTVLEFALTDSIYSELSPYNDVMVTAFGSIIDLHKHETTKYFRELHFSQKIDIEYIYSHIMRKLKFLSNNTGLKTICELSGGFDSRLIFVILQALKTEFECSTNRNIVDSFDSSIAIQLAEKAHKKIHLLNLEEEERDYSGYIRDSLLTNEISRDSYKSIKMRKVYNLRSCQGELVLGGYGGELFRDVKYKGISGLSDLLTKKYRGDYSEEYFKELERKFTPIVHSDNPKEIGERTYYFLRMAYWGGSRISRFNEYCYYFHPLLDYSVLAPVLAVEKKDKDHSKFMMTLMERFDPVITRQMSSYGYNFKWHRLKVLEMKISGFIMKIIQKLKGGSINNLYSDLGAKDAKEIIDRYSDYIPFDYVNFNMIALYKIASNLKIWELSRELRSSSD